MAIYTFNLCHTNNNILSVIDTYTMPDHLHNQIYLYFLKLMSVFIIIYIYIYIYIYLYNV